jgi:HK97 family phage prohead protease
MTNEVGFQMAGIAQQQAAEGSRADKRGVCEVPALFLKSIDQKKRQIRVLANSSALDRHGERLLPEAFAGSIARFMENPVLMPAHQHRLENGEPPVIGRVVKLWIDRQELWAIIEFAETELAEQYWQLYSRGFMKAVSVGFIAKKGEWSSEEGVRLYVHTEVELLEISCVPVPSNPESLVKNTGGANSWLEAKKAEREDAKIMRDIYAENPNFDAECEEFARLLLTGDYIEDSELSDSDEEEGMNFAELIRAGTRSDQPVAGLPRNCNQAASTFFEDACDLSAVESFRIGERDRTAPHSTSQFENPFYEV